MISIVIPNYNGMEHLSECLNSLEKQTLKPSEIIIVDNNSTDGSKEYIRLNYPDVLIIELNKNYGFSKAVNEGIKISRSPFVVLMNNDTEAEENWLDELYKAIISNDNIFSCSSKMIRYHDRSIIDDAGDGYTILGWSKKYGDGKYVEKYDADREIFSSCAGAAIYRKSCFERIGYFDENFFAYLEDVDIGYRARLFKYKNIFASKAVIYHKGSATTGSRHNAFKAKLVSRNNIVLIYKNMPLIQILINLPFIFLGYLIKLIYFTVKGMGKEYIHGIVDGFMYISKYKYTRKKNISFLVYLHIQWLLIKNTIGIK